MPETRSRRNVGQTPKGVRKVAVLLVSVDQETAARLMGQLSRTQHEQIAMEIGRLATNPATREEREQVLKDFHATAVLHEGMEHGGIDYARRILERLYSPEEARQLVRSAADRMSPFGFLQNADRTNLLTFLSEEHPQTIALVLAHLEGEQAAGLLEQFPVRKQQEVVRRLACMEQTSPEVIQQVERALESRLSGFLSGGLRQAGGVDAAANILNRLPRSAEGAILEGLIDDEPELVDQIRRKMFTFDDLVKVNDRGIQTMLRNIETARMALALKTASDAVRDKFYRNMSPRVVENVREEMEGMGPVRLSDVEAAQQAIVDIARQLEEQGDLFVEGRGDTELV